MSRNQSLRVVATARSEDVQHVLAGLADKLNGTKFDVHFGKLSEIGAPFIEKQAADILLLDLDIDSSDDFGVLEQLRSSRRAAATPIIATSSHVTTAATRQLLRDGIQDFVAQPLSAPDILDAIRIASTRVNQPQRSPARNSFVLSFSKAAGGMGATTLAVQSACNLLRHTKSKEKETAEVCLLDLDLQFGGAALSLDLPAGEGMMEIINNPKRLDGELLRGSMNKHRSGLYVLPAPVVPMPLDALNPEVVAGLIQTAREQFDFVVIDLPHALTRWTDAVLTNSDIIALVVQPTVQAIHQTRRMLDMLQDEGHYTLPLKVIVNRHKRSWGSAINVKETEVALNRKVDHVIPNDFKLVNSAMNQGAPVYEIKKRSSFERHISTMLEQLMADAAEADAAQAAA